MNQYTIQVQTPGWAGSEVFGFSVVACSQQHANQLVQDLIGRDLPQGGRVVSCVVRERRMGR